MLFHEHADGGLYFKVGDVNLKNPATGAWLDGVSYLPVNGIAEHAAGLNADRPCVTTLVRWQDRFTPTYRRTSEEAARASVPWFVLGLIAALTALSLIISAMVLDYRLSEVDFGLIAILAGGWAWAWGRWQRERGRFDIRFRKPRP